MQPELHDWHWTIPCGATLLPPSPTRRPVLPCVSVGAADRTSVDYKEEQLQNPVVHELLKIVKNERPQGILGPMTYVVPGLHDPVGSWGPTSMVHGLKDQLGR